MTGGRKSLWKCPRCGHRFVTRNLWHSCVRVRLADHFRGKDPKLRQLFARLKALVRSCGPATCYAQKTRIVFQARVRFVGAVVHRDWLEVSLWLRRRVAHPRLRRVESFGRLGYGHGFRLEQAADLDAAFARLVGEAYEAARRQPRRQGRQGMFPATWAGEVAR